MFRSDGVDRRVFLSALAATAGVAATGAPADAQVAASVARSASLRDGRHSLVLAGGANRGAYQAGVIGGLVARDGLRDGEPLGFAAVCGTSIGALNGYFVATAQYARLRELWREVATRDVFRLKPTFERIPEPSAGVATRAYEAISLGFGLIKNVRGILDSAPIVQLLDENVQPATDAVHIPLYIATTNLTRRSGQLFVREATTPDGRTLQAVNAQLIADFAPGSVRVAGDTLIRRVLLASASIPIALDPQSLPAADGSPDEYVDGGVTDNVPLEIARRCAEYLNVILVDPPLGVPDEQDHSGLDVALGVFETMQRRILEYEVLLAIAETALVPTPLTDAAGLARLPATFSLVQPDRPLPGKFGDFNDLRSLDEMWERGYEDGVRGWPALDLSVIRTRGTIP
jgi:predicted acylesterase/phospholipase RssA